MPILVPLVTSARNTATPTRDARTSYGGAQLEALTVTGTVLSSLGQHPVCERTHPCVCTEQEGVPTRSDGRWIHAFGWKGTAQPRGLVDQPRNYLTHVHVHRRSPRLACAQRRLLVYTERSLNEWDYHLPVSITLFYPNPYTTTPVSQCYFSKCRFVPLRWWRGPSRLRTNIPVCVGIMPATCSSTWNEVPRCGCRY